MWSNKQNEHYLSCPYASHSISRLCMDESIMQQSNYKYKTLISLTLKSVRTMPQGIWNTVLSMGYDLNVLQI